MLDLQSRFSTGWMSHRRWLLEITVEVIFPPYLPFLPIPFLVPKSSLGITGSTVSSPSGSEQSPTAKWFFVHFDAETAFFLTCIMTHFYVLLYGWHVLLVLKLNQDTEMRHRTYSAVAKNRQDQTLGQWSHRFFGCGATPPIEDILPVPITKPVMLKIQITVFFLISTVNTYRRPD